MQHGTEEHKAFCEKWKIVDRDQDFPFWELMLEEMRDKLDEGQFLQIPVKVARVFADASITRLKIELKIWTFENLNRFLTEYILKLVLKNGINQELDDKVISIGKNVLNPLLKT